MEALDVEMRSAEGEQALQVLLPFMREDAGHARGVRSGEGYLQAAAKLNLLLGKGVKRQFSRSAREALAQDITGHGLPPAAIAVNAAIGPLRRVRPMVTHSRSAWDIMSHMEANGPISVIQGNQLGDQPFVLCQCGQSLESRCAGLSIELVDERLVFRAQSLLYVLP